MKAEVEGGLLDRILKAPEGSTCTVSFAEVNGIALALARAPHDPAIAEILGHIWDGEPFQFLGRTIIVT